MLPHVNVFEQPDQPVPYWTVTAITRYIRQSLEMDYRLQDVWVEGEVSNVGRPASGHLYFTLKDADASLRCVMWRPQAAKLPALPVNGDLVEVHGQISVYEAGGAYQLYADRIRPAGEGEAFQEFLRVKALLEEEGLFDPARKRSLPSFPLRIGVVASPTSAGFRDVLHVLERRFPLATVVLVPTAVQGEQAPAQIVSAIEAMNAAGNVDILLLIRGGGSAEDLRAFSTEEVVRAVAASRVPTVTGIGHETDLVLADYAADVRAPTPSAAAEVAVPDQRLLQREIADHRMMIQEWFREDLRTRSIHLERIITRLHSASPKARIDNARQRVDDRLRQLSMSMDHHLTLRRGEIGTLLRTLQAIGPADVLARGYAIVQRREDGVFVRSVKDVSPGVRLTVRVSDGVFDADIPPDAAGNGNQTT